MALKDVHFVLQADLLDRLGSLARALDVSRNLLVRQAIEEFLALKERERLDQEMDPYIQEMAPYSGEFVAETEGETEPPRFFSRRVRQD
ncbi:ribbon-helix-helix protein, CopG family [bacterium]|nr:ribbon-helix-helix protein, CopG family [bacterium]